MVVVTDRYTQWWEKHRQRRTRKEIEEARNRHPRAPAVSDYIGRIEAMSC